MENAPPLPKAEIIHKFLQDCLNDKNKEAVSCGDQHHRPLEALKLMLFKLQAIQGSFSQHGTAEQEEELERVSSRFLTLYRADIHVLCPFLRKTHSPFNRLDFQS
ncbi:hypothetical protein Q9233_015491 [Columba guinea]|nr:hypothetical protein Q9233_015491 [Columba guinea]